MINILLVDDEKKICEFVKAYLDKEGYNTDVVYDGNSAIEHFDKNKYQLIILDRMLPDISGEKVCDYIRKKSTLPIIMLTARVEDEDRIEGFQLGCDDYICKPFNVKELILRVKAILKRSGVSEDQVMKFDDELEINTTSHEVMVRGEMVILTNTEYKILLTMASNPKKIFTREELLEISTEDHYVKIDRVIDSHIKNLRQKIKLEEKDNKIIQTVYGVGYKFGL
ncbi:MAG: response regulator transcription factor [Peptostreptococcaceae bacterium]